MIPESADLFKREGAVRLLADATLGRLARWLRMAGYDTAFLSDTDEWAVLRRARAEGRLLLTRDRALAGRRGVRALLIEAEEVEEQLRQVWEVVGPPPEGARARCPVCNTPLVRAGAEAAARVPLYVRRRYAGRLVWCGQCERVYWPGSHWQRMHAWLDRLRDGEGSDTMDRVE